MVAVGKKQNGMIDKIIICLSARANSGKTTSIRELFFRLTGHYPAGCEIIVCASRTSKDTVNTVYELASKNQYKVVQISALHGEHNDTIENYNLYCCKNAEAIEQLIRNIIRNQLKTIEL